MIRLKHLSTIKDWTGLFEVTVSVNDKNTYTYVLTSQFDVDEFEKKLWKHPGSALNWLKKVAIECIKQK